MTNETTKPVVTQADCSPAKYLIWHDGCPPKHLAQKWFIAQTTFNDRVVLTALPEEYTYDFKTADDTYIKADKIKWWMQFPDSEYIPHSPSEPSVVSQDLVEQVKTLQEQVATLTGALLTAMEILSRCEYKEKPHA